ncbi:YitT family protein [Lachnotalea sp. AF33-28]|uniref:YitT family protein n=1 Tax=Lachnotalea sp. AF33-28 TaxID=2292046 RepID=UPI001FAA4768|nr:YitT family protein [Lachnotalea sp. AF33-28]
MKELLNRYEIRRTLTAVFGTAIFAAGVNLFTVPIGLYSGGFVGISQIIRTVLVEYLHLNAGDFDIAGVVFWIINLPVLFMGYRVMGRVFMVKTILCVTTLTLFMSLIPIPKAPLIEEPLASCFIGGIVAGYGIGLVLKEGSSGGGLDIVGLYFAKKNKNSGVGRMSLIVNVGIYAVCAVMFNAEIVVYSVIYTVFYSMVIDKVHLQNINVQAVVITKKAADQIAGEVMKELGRGVTVWDARGAYTGEEEQILYVLLSKYEVGQLRRIVYGHNPEAFVIVEEGPDITGNFLKKL